MIILKVGGGADINFEGIATNLADAKNVIVVLGANAERDRLAEKLGVPKKVVKSVKGYESVLSDEHAIDVMMMAYSGLQGTRFVEACQKNNVNAIRLSGLDGRVIQGKRNTGFRVRENNKVIMKRDLSGKPIAVNTQLIKLLLDNGYIPILTMPIIDEDGFAINSENDDVVVALHDALNADTVIQLIEAPGFLDDASNPESVVPTMTRDELAGRELSVEGRMKRKLHALNKLQNTHPTRLIISDGRTENPLKDALAGKGTVIQ